MTSVILDKPLNPLKQDLYNIKKFKPFTNKKSEVGAHFALKKHDVDRHFKICIFRANKADWLQVKKRPYKLIFNSKENAYKLKNTSK